MLCTRRLPDPHFLYSRLSVGLVIPVNVVVVVVAAGPVLAQTGVLLVCVGTGACVYSVVA